MQTHRLASDLYALYVTLFDSKFAPATKQRCFEAAGIELRPWLITHISQNALAHMVKERNATGLRRGHKMSRSDRANAIFGSGQKLQQDELLTFFYENDTVTLVTAAENATDGTKHWSTRITVPTGRLTKGSYSVAVAIPDLLWADSTWGGLSKP